MNKISTIFSMIALAIVGLVFNACTADVDVPAPAGTKAFIGTRAEVAHPVFGLFESDFIAAKHEKAGTIAICNDYENVYVKFTTVDGWQMGLTHLFIGPKEILLDPANGYVNKNGSPKNGHFPYGEGFEPMVTEWEFALPLTDLYAMFGLNFEEDKDVDVCPIIAAHAAVAKQLDPETWQTETAWGNGQKFVKKGDWSMYIEGYCVEFPPVDPPTPPTYDLDEESAWAFDKDNPLEYGGNWAKFIQYNGEPLTVMLLAGHKDTDMTVTLTPEGDKVKMVFAGIMEIAPENDGRWVLKEVTEAIKIQGYAEPPFGTNPVPGHFTYYKGRELEVIVDAANYYGIHVDVAKLTYKK